MILLASFLVFVLVFNGELQPFGDALQHIRHLNVSQSYTRFISHSASYLTFAAHTLTSDTLDRLHVQNGSARAC